MYTHFIYEPTFMYTVHLFRNFENFLCLKAKKNVPVNITLHYYEKFEQVVVEWTSDSG